MQALSFGSPSTMATPAGVPRGITATPEGERSEVAKPASDRLINMTRLTATKPDLRTPSRFPVDSNGQRLCSTPKLVRAAGGVRSHASQTPKTIRECSVMRNHSSPTPKKTQVGSGVENHASLTPKKVQVGSGLDHHASPTSKVVQRGNGVENRASPTPKKVQGRGGVENHSQNSLEDSVGADDLPLDTFTVYVNPSFEPLETLKSPSKEQKQPSCIPVDSNGQKLCPTPRRTQSPGGSKLRFPKANSSQRLGTIQSPSGRKDQAKSVLVDSNGQNALGTPKLSKQFTTPRERSAAFGTNGSENLTPRALFNDSHAAAVTPRSISRITHMAAAKESKPSEGVDGASCTSAVKKEVGSKLKKRGRNEDGAAVEDENARVTRSKTEAEKIALFLRSPAARVRPDGRKEEYWHGVSDVLLERYTETKLLSASKSEVER